MRAVLPEFETVRLDLQAGVLRVTLNRPESRNALSDEMVADLNALCAVLENRTDIRALVLGGSNGHFCAGGDIKGFRAARAAQAPVEGTADTMVATNRAFGAFLLRFNALPQVTIAVVEGSVLGGGLGLVCVSDIALATESARFAVSETGLGLIPAQIAPFLVNRIGLTEARRLALTGARFDGVEAARLGLVHWACADSTALEAKCNASLADIRRCAPHANAATKALLLQVGRAPIETVLDHAAQAFAEAMCGTEAREGIASFLEKRPARWIAAEGCDA